MIKYLNIKNPFRLFVQNFEYCNGSNPLNGLEEEKENSSMLKLEQF